LFAINCPLTIAITSDSLGKTFPAGPYYGTIVGEKEEGEGKRLEGLASFPVRIICANSGPDKAGVGEALRMYTRQV